MSNGSTNPRFLHVFPTYAAGGAELRITRIINSLNVDTSHTIMSLSGDTSAAHHLNSDSNTTVVSGPKKRGPLSYPFDLWRQIRSISPDVLITYNWGATDAIIGAAFNRFSPVIHNECGLSNEVDGKRFRRRFARRFLLKKCHRVVVTAESYFNLVRDSFRVHPEKITLIRTGVDTGRFAEVASGNLKRACESDSGKTIFGYVGSLRRSKNLPMLIHAFAALKGESRLVLFGDGPERPHLISLVKDLGIESKVDFRGRVDDVRVAFESIDVCVSTSLSEAASNSLLEAMASGLPVVCCDIADNRVILSEANRPFVFRHEQFEDFINGMRQLSIDPQLRHRLGAENQARVRDVYPLDEMLTAYGELWESVARSSKRSKIGSGV